MNVLELDTPALIVDLDAMEFNIKRMAEYFRTKRARLRPHVKTHKTPIIAHKQIAAGAVGITCAKLGEAEVMTEGGLSDILLANQLIGEKKIQRLVSLRNHSEIIVAVDDKGNASDISKAANFEGIKIDVVAEVDIGLNRCGILSDEASDLVKHIKSCSGLIFRGLMGYEGHCMFVSDRNERKRMAEDALAKLMHAKELVERSGDSVEIVSAGGTGTYDIAGEYPGVTEVQAGSYVMMDGRYKALDLGFECALFLLSTVTSKRKNRSVIDAGLKTCGVERGLPVVVEIPDAKFLAFNEEHAVLELPDESALKVGDKLKLLPAHGDTTINIHDYYYGIRKGELETIWKIQGRGRST